MADLHYAEIHYGGDARLWGRFDKSSVESVFMRHANQCFGIRKSIADFDLKKIKAVKNLPKPWNNLEGAAVVLEHNCGGPGWAFKDTIVFDADGNKLKDEWD